MRVDVSPQMGSTSFLESIRTTEIETNTAAERRGGLTISHAKDFLALKNKKRLQALHRIGNHLQDGKIAATPDAISDATAIKFLLLQKNLHAIGGPSLVREFLSTPYCLQFVEQFSDIDPKKIALSFHSKSLVEQIGAKRKLEGRALDPQFIPALNLGVFVALEHLQAEDIKNLNPKEAAKLLEQKKLNTTKWNEKILYGNLSRYLSKIPNQKISPAERDQRVAEFIISEVHSRLEHWTKLRKVMGQSQGTETEIMQWTTEKDWQEWSDRFKLKKTLPRGLKPEMVGRTDWMLVGILGLKEDLGEKAHEIFEMSTLPSESGTAQATIMQELMLGGFLDEKVIEGGKERYSVHSSSVFPAEIFQGNPEGAKQYVNFARAMGGAFSSLDRMKNGGWVTTEDGWDYEIFWNNLKSRDKITPVAGHSLSGNELLVEIRTLDVTSKDHLSALINKEYLDYGFRTYWQQRLGYAPRSSMDLQAAAIWQNFDAELTRLNYEYNVEDHWQGTGNARERHPEYQQELQKLIRSHARDIRQVVETPESEIDYYTTTGEIPAVCDALAAQENNNLPADTVKLPVSIVEDFGISEGGYYSLKMGSTTRTVKVVIDHETMDDFGISYSSDIKKFIPIPNDCKPRLKFDHDKREIAIGPVIGIAATPHDSSDITPFGNILDWPLFNAQMEEAKNAGAIIYVFNPEQYDDHKNMVKGYQLKDSSLRYVLDDAESRRKSYIQVLMPVPDIIYDWTSAGGRDSDGYRSLVSKVPTSNEGSTTSVSADKLAFFGAMSEVPALAKRMPEVVEFFGVSDIKKMLDKHNFIVMKPRWGEEGASIIYIRKLPDGKLEYSNPHWQAPPGGSEMDEEWTVPSYQTVSSVEELLDQTVKIRSNWTMILQEGVAMLEFPEKGYDGRTQMEIRTIIYRDQSGHLAILGKEEKLELSALRMAPHLGLENAVKIASTAQKIALLAALQHDKVLGDGVTSLLAVDCFIGADGKVWLGESNSGPTLVWYNQPGHPYLLHELAREQMKVCVVKSGFSPVGKA